MARQGDRRGRQFEALFHTVTGRAFRDVVRETSFAELKTTLSL